MGKRAVKHHASLVVGEINSKSILQEAMEDGTWDACVCGFSLTLAVAHEIRVLGLEREEAWKGRGKDFNCV